MERDRFHPDGAIYFVTFSVVEWLPVFVSEKACQIVTDRLNFWDGKKGRTSRDRETCGQAFRRGQETCAERESQETCAERKHVLSGSGSGN